MCNPAVPDANCPNPSNTVNLDASPTSPQPAGITYQWQLVNSPGALGGTTGITTTWSIQCLGGQNQQIQLNIRLTASASGFVTGTRDRSWPIFVNECGSEPLNQTLQRMLHLARPAAASRLVAR
jgi:hypothetical protein